MSVDGDHQLLVLFVFLLQSYYSVIQNVAVSTVLVLCSSAGDKFPTLPGCLIDIYRRSVVAESNGINLVSTADCHNCLLEAGQNHPDTNSHLFIKQSQNKFRLFFLFVANYLQ